MDLFIIIAGLVLVVLTMALIINPPEALVKRAYLGRAQVKKRTEPGAPPDDKKGES